MMKRFILSTLFSIVYFSLFAQFGIGGFGQQKPSKPEPHVQWEITTSAEEVCVGDQIKIIFKGDIDRKWHMYSVGFECDPGPGLASVELEGKGFKKVGDLVAIGDESHVEEYFDDCESRLFEGKSYFEQVIKITDANPEIDAKLSYQVCTEGSCIPESSPMITLKPKMGNKCKSEVSVVPKNQVNELVKSSSTECCAATQDSLAKIRGDIASLEKKVDSYFNPDAVISGNSDCKITRKPGFDDITIEGVPEVDESADFIGLILTFGASFLFGLIALLTPCVFPLIPMTVTFFTHSSKTKAGAIGKAVTYGISIVVIYTALGLLVSKLMGPSAANELATGWINILFFVIFFVFALSFLGLFEITLPSKFVNKMDAQSEKGGLLGIFFMAFTLVLVSFSCTGPIVSSTLILSSQGHWLKPIAGMLGFSLALAIPFALFAIFPHALNKLPKSGGWLNVVKVVLGLLELAVGLKFLSNADLANHWGIMDRDTFLILWIAIFVIMGIYLLGKIRLPHDSPVEKLSVFRLLIAIGTFAFVIYLIPGLFGAPLKMLAGITPPMSTQDFVIGRDAYLGEGELCDDPMYADKLHIPHGLKGYFDVRQAICCAQQQNKPIFVDFTGHGCANCRRMEEMVWTDNDVKKRLNEDFVILSLYVDDRKIELDKDEFFTNKSGDLVTKLGEYNFSFELEKFNQVAQPYYVILGVDEKNSTPDDIRLKLMAEPYTYDSNIEKFNKFLKDAKKKYIESKLMTDE